MMLLILLICLIQECFTQSNEISLFMNQMNCQKYEMKDMAKPPSGVDKNGIYSQDSKFILLVCNNDKILFQQNNYICLPISTINVYDQIYLNHTINETKNHNETINNHTINEINNHNQTINKTINNHNCVIK